MKVLFSFTLLVVIFSLFACIEEPPCTGFYNEPFLTFHSDSLPFNITVKSPNGFVANFNSDTTEFVVEVPLDMHASTLTLDLNMPNFKGSMIFNYEIEAKECGDDFHQLLFVENLRLDTNSTYDEVYLENYQFAEKLSESTRRQLDLVPRGLSYDGGAYGFWGDLYLK